MLIRMTALGLVLIGLLAGTPAVLSTSAFELQSAIVFVSTRHAPTLDPNATAEIYIMKGDGTDLQRLTEVDAVACSIIRHGQEVEHRSIVPDVHRLQRPVGGDIRFDPDDR